MLDNQFQSRGESLFLINPEASDRRYDSRRVRLNALDPGERTWASPGLSVVLGVLSVTLRAELTDSSGSKRSTWGFHPDVSSWMWVRFSKRDEKGKDRKRGFTHMQSERQRFNFRTDGQMHSGAQLLSILSQQWCTDYDFFTQINFNFILFLPLLSHISGTKSFKFTD